MISSESTAQISFLLSRLPEVIFKYTQFYI